MRSKLTTGFDRHSLCVTRFPGTLNGSLVFTKVYESSRQACPIRNAGEQEFRGLIQLILETFLSNFQDVSHIGHAKEVLHVVKSVSLGISIGQFGVDLGFTERLASHLEEADQVIVLACAI